jgi:FtsP/CotA-like multicopper oxidase with cupredoxin domain
MTILTYLSPIVIPTIVLTAYADNDVVGGLLTWSLAGLSSNGGLITGALLTDVDNQSEPYRLFLYDDLPTTILDDAAFTTTKADSNKLFNVWNFAALNYFTVNSIGHCFATENSAQSNRSFAAPRGNIYGYLVANGSTPDQATLLALSLKLFIVSE